MSQVTELVPPTDERPITPAALNKALTIGTEAEASVLVDESYEWLTGNVLGGRPLARASWREVLHDAEFDKDLRLSRWPVERTVAADTIQVDHGDDPLDPDQYTVTNQCRSVLHRELDVDSDLLHFHHRPIFDPNPRPGIARHFSVPLFIAGYLMPGQLEIWAAAVEWAAGRLGTTSYDSQIAFGWARATDRTVPFRFEVTGGPGTVAIEPIWPTVAGESFTATGAPNDVTFTARYAVEVKPIYATALIKIAKHLKDANKGVGKPCKGDDCGSIEGQILSMISGAC